jgi:hypothetical protein
VLLLVHQFYALAPAYPYLIRERSLFETYFSWLRACQEAGFFEDKQMPLAL